LCVNYQQATLDLTLYDASAPRKIVFLLLFPVCCYAAKICRSSCGGPCLWGPVRPNMLDMPKSASEHMVPWAHVSPHTKRHLNRIGRFWRAHDCDRPTDRQTTLLGL